MPQSLMPRQLKTLADAIGLSPEQIHLDPRFKESLQEKVCYQQVRFDGQPERIYATTSATEWAWDGNTRMLTRLGFAGKAKTTAGRPQPKGKMVKDTYQLPLSVSKYLLRLSHACKKSKNDMVAASIIAMYNSMERPGERK